MDPPELETTNQEDETSANERVERFCRKYNIRLEILKNTWVSRTILPTREAGDLLQQFGGATSGRGVDIANTYSAIAGSFIRKVSPLLPQTTLEIGEKPPPANIRSLTFKGEFMSGGEAMTHKIFHEIGHTAIFYEMVDALETLHPRADLNETFKYYGAVLSELRKSPRPLSMLDKIPGANGGSFYTPEEMIYEDLAEALAVRFTGRKEWDEYAKYIRHGSTLAQKYFPDIEKLVNSIYARSMLAR